MKLEGRGPGMSYNTGVGSNCLSTYIQAQLVNVPFLNHYNDANAPQCVPSVVAINGSVKTRIVRFNHHVHFPCSLCTCTPVLVYIFLARRHPL